MATAKKKSPAQMRDEVLNIIYKQAKDGILKGTALTQALNSLARMAEADKTPVEQTEDEQTVGATIGDIKSLPPARRVEIMRKWRARYEVEFRAIDDAILAAQRDQDREAA